MSTKSRREYGLDWLRVGAFLILIFYHCSLPFTSWGFHIQNPEKSKALEYVLMFFNRWRLPLLFFISGAGVSFALGSRGWGQFLQERATRLLIPLFFGLAVIVPPQVYVERLWQGQTFDSYWQFYRTLDDGIYPQGNLSWHHLWFIAYLFVYSVIALPLFLWLRKNRGVDWLESTIGFLCGQKPAMYLIALPSVIAGWFLVPHWPVTYNLFADWANFAGGLITFAFGFLFGLKRELLDVVTRRRREFLYAGILCAVIFYFSLSRDWPLLYWLVVSSYFGMFWIFTLVGYARTYLDRPSEALRYCNEGVYPFYIVHQTILMLAAYKLVQWDISMWVKLPLLCTITFLGSWASFEIVRRIRWMRPLFGLKKLKGGNRFAEPSGTGTGLSPSE